jgi:hypothetical protein
MAISPDETRWIASRPNYFLNVEALGALFLTATREHQLKIQLSLVTSDEYLSAVV